MTGDLAAERRLPAKTQRKKEIANAIDHQVGGVLRLAEHLWDMRIDSLTTRRCGLLGLLFDDARWRQECF